MDLPEAPEALPLPIVDSHCHLDSTEELSGLTPDDAIARAARVGVTRIVQIGCDVAGSRWAVAAARRLPQVIAGVALHPNDAARLGPAMADGLAEIAGLAADPLVRAVGETGLDYFRTPDPDGRRRQRDAFAAHIALGDGLRQDPGHPRPGRARRGPRRSGRDGSAEPDRDALLLRRRGLRPGLP